MPRRSNKVALACGLRGGVLLILLSTAGCTYRRTVGFDDDRGRAAAHSLNDRAAESIATVTLSTGFRADVIALQVAPDSTSWIDSQTRDVWSVATSDVVDVRFTDRRRGLLEGLLTGTVVGAIDYLLRDGCVGCRWLADLMNLPYARNDPNPAESFPVRAVKGAIVGAWVGGLVGSRDVYLVSTSGDSDSIVACRKSDEPFSKCGKLFVVDR